MNGEIALDPPIINKMPNSNNTIITGASQYFSLCLINLKSSTINSI
jgi:hypothetical protein